MNYVDTTLHISHAVEHDCELDSGERWGEEQKAVQLLNHLVELNYIHLSENSLQLTKSGHDYFMRKCQVEVSSFQFDPLGGDLQQLIYQTFFKGKSGINTVEKFMKYNLSI
jgi:hypothetical protein